MSKILVVFGATGQQGGSVIDYVLNDSELSQQYKIRAITRDVNSEKARALKEKAEVVEGDVAHRATIEAALDGAHTVFAMTTPSFGPNAVEDEYQNGKTIADIAVEKSVKSIIFSTLPAVAKISGGKYTHVTAFDAKAKIEQYIRQLPIKSAFYLPGWFMENFQSQPFLNPKQDPDGTWILRRNVSPDTKFPFINAVKDTGKFIGAILAEPAKYEGKTYYAATALYSIQEIASILSKATGKTVVYKQTPREEFKKSLPFAPEIFLDAFSFEEEFGYFGPDAQRQIDLANENARGKLTTLEEFMETHPLEL